MTSTIIMFSFQKWLCTSGSIFICMKNIGSITYRYIYLISPISISLLAEELEKDRLHSKIICVMILGVLLFRESDKKEFSKAKKIIKACRQKLKPKNWGFPVSDNWPAAIILILKENRLRFRETLFLMTLNENEKYFFQSPMTTTSWLRIFVFKSQTGVFSFNVCTVI